MATFTLDSTMNHKYTLPPRVAKNFGLGKANLVFHVDYVIPTSQVVDECSKKFNHHPSTAGNQTADMGTVNEVFDKVVVDIKCSSGKNGAIEDSTFEVEGDTLNTLEFVRNILLPVKISLVKSFFELASPKS